MKTEIDWLPNIDKLEQYFNKDGIIDYSKLINERHNDLMTDFYSKSESIYFKGKKVVLNEVLLNCDKLKDKNCYNNNFYTCTNCPFEDKFDIFNHVCTKEYTAKALNKKNGKMKLKPKYKKNSSIPRTPGDFSIPRTLRVGWIKSIILNSNDIENVSQTRTNDGYTITLLKRNYRICLKEVLNKDGEVKYFVLKSAYYTGMSDVELAEQNINHIKEAEKRRNATSGVSTTLCIDS